MGQGTDGEPPEILKQPASATGEPNSGENRKIKCPGLRVKQTPGGIELYHLLATWSQQCHFTSVPIPLHIQRNGLQVPSQGPGLVKKTHAHYISIVPGLLQMGERSGYRRYRSFHANHSQSCSHWAQVPSRVGASSQVHDAITASC